MLNLNHRTARVGQPSCGWRPPRCFWTDTVMNLEKHGHRGAKTKAERGLFDNLLFHFRRERVPNMDGPDLLEANCVT